MHPLLFIALMTTVTIGIVLYSKGGSGAQRLDDPRGTHGDLNRLAVEMRAELNRHPRSNLRRRW